MNNSTEDLKNELENRKAELKEDLKKSKKTCSGCLLTLLIIILAITGISVYVSRMPEFKPILTCVQNQIEIYNAIHRYKDLNNSYPKNLDIIKNEYLSNPDVLYCPMDKNKEGYEYINPDKEKNTVYILRCKRHQYHNQPFPPLTITKEGKFSYDMEEFEKSIKQIK